MHYYGGKYRTGKEIAEILKKITRQIKINGYIEPFCGALGVMRHMTNDYYPCYAFDGCEDLILLWKAIQDNSFKKPEMTEKKWLELKYSTIPSALRAYAGFGCSFSGRWFSTYDQKYSKNIDRNQQVYNSIINISISNVTFCYKDYKKHLKKIENGGYLIYCDPPYAESLNKHKASSFNFDSNEFWNIMRKWKLWGNIVVISERHAPRDFTCIWKKKIANLHVDNLGKKNEYEDKLFI